MEVQTEGSKLPVKEDQMHYQSGKGRKSKAEIVFYKSSQ